MAYTREEYEQVYAFAEQLVFGRISAPLAQSELEDKLSQPPSNLAMTLDFFRCCIVGVAYKRGVSKPAVEFALSKSADNAHRCQTTVECIRLFVEYANGQQGNKRPGIAKMLSKFVASQPVTSKGLIDLQEIKKNEAEEVNVASDLSDEELEVLASTAPSGSVVPVTTRSSYRPRNPHVKALCLRRAKGVCFACKTPAPFFKDDGTPFLEVHHKIPLAMGGADTIENTVALCPNCHRQAHYGAERHGMFS